MGMAHSAVHGVSISDSVGGRSSTSIFKQLRAELLATACWNNLCSRSKQGFELRRRRARCIAERLGRGHGKDRGFTEELQKGFFDCAGHCFDTVDRFTGSRGGPVLRERKFAKGTKSRSESLLAEAGRAVVVAVPTTDFVYRITEERRHYFEEL